MFHPSSLPKPVVGSDSQLLFLITTKILYSHHRAEVQAIGAGAVNQAVKALVLATGYLKNDGIDIACVPEFADVAIDDKVRTAIKLVIEPRK